jgi:hypothetical protein
MKTKGFGIIKTDHYKNPHLFYQWLVGFTDGDGTFTIDRQCNGKIWNLVYKISQKSTKNYSKF